MKTFWQASVHSMMSGQWFFVRSDNGEEIALKFELMLSLPSVVISLLLRQNVLKNHKKKGLQKHIWRAVESARHLGIW